MLIEKYINVALNEKEMNLIEQIAEEQDMTINMAMRLIFQQGLDKLIEEVQENEKN